MLRFEPGRGWARDFASAGASGAVVGALPARQNLNQAALHRQVTALSGGPLAETPGAEQAGPRGMPGQDAEVSVQARHLDAVCLLAHHGALRVPSPSAIFSAISGLLEFLGAGRDLPWNPPGATRLLDAGFPIKEIRFARTRLTMKAAMLRRLAPFWLAAVAVAGEPLYDLQGRVQPAGEAAISLFGAVTPFNTSVFSSDGRFHFHKLLPGTYTIAVFSPGRGEARRTLEIGPGTADARRRVAVDLDFAPGDFTFSEPVRRQHTVSARDLAIPDKALRDYEEAGRALSRRDTASAVSHLEQAVEAAPQFAAAWNELGTIAYQTQHFDRAEECFLQALDQDPKAYEPLVNLGGVEVTLHKTDRALDYNIYAVLTRPNDALANSQLGQTYFQAGNDDLALKYLEIARRLDPAHFSHPQLVMAEIHLRRKQRAAAASDLEDFLKFHPDWPKAAEMRRSIAEWRRWRK